MIARESDKMLFPEPKPNVKLDTLYVASNRARENAYVSVQLSVVVFACANVITLREVMRNNKKVRNRK